MEGQDGGMIWLFAVVGGAIILGCVLAYMVIANRRATRDPRLTRLQEEGARRARKETARESPD